MKLMRGAAEILADTHRHKVLVMGRRWGKTYYLIPEILKGFEEGPGDIWYIAPFYRQAKEIMWEPLKEYFPRTLMSGKPNETELSIRTKSGYSVKLKGADNPDSLRGKGLRKAVFDEYDFMAPHVWTRIIRPMLGTTRGRAVFVGTPEGYKNLHKLYVRGQSGLDKDKNWASWQRTTLDGGWVPKSEINEAMGDMDEKTFRQEYLATFETSSGRVYYAFDRTKNCAIIDNGIMKANSMVGMDFNVDPMSGIIFVDTPDMSYILDTIEIPGSNTEEMCREVEARYGKACNIAYPDPAGRARKTSAHVGVTDHSILRKHGFDVRTRLTVSVRDGINAVNARFRTADGKIHTVVNSECERAIEVFEQFKYKPGTSQPMDDEFSHLADAWRYPCDLRHSLIERPSWSQA
jgi:hypothetical protein